MEDNFDWLFEEEPEERIEAEDPVIYKSSGELKEGDYVKIKSLGWYNANKDEYGDVHTYCEFVDDMSIYCGEIHKIKSIRSKTYKLEGCECWDFSRDMFEGY